MSLPKPYYEKDGITIYNSDSFDILPKLQDKSVDMIFTDPPYGHNNNNGDLIQNWELALKRPLYAGSSPRPIQNDSPDQANACALFLFRQARRLLKENGCCCCCCSGGGGSDPQFARWSLWMDQELTFKQMVVWDKGPIGMGWHYRRSYETVLVGYVGDKCRWYDDTDKVENIIRHIPKIIPQANEHPTAKPKALAGYFIQLHTQTGDIVLDPFMGAGSTLEACSDLGRKFIGIEIEERWCEMAVKRLNQQVFNFS